MDDVVLVVILQKFDPPTMHSKRYSIDYVLHYHCALWDEFGAIADG